MKPKKKSKPRKRFRFVVLEGCEGSGKTTQFNLIKKKYLKGVFFREPGGTDFAENEMRRLLLNSPISPELTPFESMGLFFTGRSHNIRSFVAPAKAKGRHVFADRFDGSSFAYQIFGMEGKHLFGHFESNRLLMGPLECLPTLYIVLDVSPEVGMARVKRRREASGVTNHFDARGPEFHARVRAGYHRFAELYQGKVRIVNAERSVEQVWSEVEAILEEHLTLPKPSKK